MGVSWLLEERRFPPSPRMGGCHAIRRCPSPSLIDKSIRSLVLAWFSCRSQYTPGHGGVQDYKRGFADRIFASVALDAALRWFKLTGFYGLLPARARRSARASAMTGEISLGSNDRATSG